MSGVAQRGAMGRNLHEICISPTDAAGLRHRSLDECARSSRYQRVSRTLAPRFRFSLHQQIAKCYVTIVQSHCLSAAAALDAHSPLCCCLTPIFALIIYALQSFIADFGDLFGPFFSSIHFYFSISCFAGKTRY